jgi:hypothetical protein
MHTGSEMTSSSGSHPYHFAGDALADVHKAFPKTVLKLFRTTKDRAVWWSDISSTSPASKRRSEE